MLSNKFRFGPTPRTRQRPHHPETKEERQKRWLNYRPIRNSIPLSLDLESYFRNATSKSFLLSAAAPNIPTHSRRQMIFLSAKIQRIFTLAAGGGVGVGWGWGGGGGGDENDFSAKSQLSFALVNHNLSNKTRGWGGGGGDSAANIDVSN